MKKREIELIRTQTIIIEILDRKRGHAIIRC